MLIRSQNRKFISDIKESTIKIIDIPNQDDGISDVQIIFYGNNQPTDAYETLGHYPSEEKALKVLDMIQDFYNSCFAFSMEDDGYYHEASLIKVFQMPQDSEVEND